MQDIYEKLLAEAEASDDAYGRCRVLLEMGHYHTGRNESAGALRCFQGSLKSAVEIGDPELEERSLEPLAVVLFHLGGIGESIAAFERLRDLARAADDRVKEARLTAFVGALHLRRGTLRDASRHLSRAARMFREAECVYDYFAVLKLAAEAARQRRTWFKAARLFEEAIRMARRAEQLHEVDELLSDLAEVFCEQGDIERARETLSEGVDVARALDDPLQEACYLLRLSDLDRRAGENLVALGRVRSALGLVAQFDEPEIISRGSILLGSILARQGQERAARAALADAARRSRRAGLDAVEADALTAYGWLLLRARDEAIRNPALAIRAARRALELAPMQSVIPSVILGYAYPRTGDEARGREWRQRAQMIRTK